MAAAGGMAWINGEFVPAGEAKVSIFDSGFIGGVAIFDTLACWQGGIFKLATHLARFERSAHAAMIPSWSPAWIWPGS
jgi:branched-chain amino acid aminotransferase